MASDKAFFAKYKSPQWQRKRLEVLNRDSFECTNCGSTDKTLHVDHAYYERGADPWEYPSESLKTLCDDCHKEFGERRKVLQKELSSGDLSTINTLIGVVRGIRGSREMEEIYVDDYEVAYGVSMVLAVKPESVIARCVDHVLSADAISDLELVGPGKAFA